MCDPCARLTLVPDCLLHYVSNVMSHDTSFAQATPYSLLPTGTFRRPLQATKQACPLRFPTPPRADEMEKAMRREEGQGGLF
jgi:hypothetical protein